MTLPDPIAIESVPAAARETALRFLFAVSCGAEASRLGATPAADRDPPLGDLLLWARQEGRILGAGWVTPDPSGQTLLVTLPRCDVAAPPALLTQLLHRLDQHLRQSGRARLAQTLLDPGSTSQVHAAEQLGFQYIARLSWFSWIARPVDAVSELGLVPMESLARPEMLGMIRETFRDSLDTAALARCLTVEEYLAAWEARCPQRPRDWYVATYEGRAVGCLLLRGEERAAEVELMYWGLLPESRGRGWGVQTLQLAQTIAARRGCLLVGSVDEANAPACKAYRRAGFLPCAQHELYVRFLQSAAGSNPHER